MMWVVADEDIGRKGDLPLMHTSWQGSACQLHCQVRTAAMDVDMEASFGLCWALLWRCTLLYECHFQACKAHDIFPALFQASRVHLDCMSPDLGTM